MTVAISMVMMHSRFLMMEKMCIWHCPWASFITQVAKSEVERSTLLTHDQ